MAVDIRLLDSKEHAQAAAQLLSSFFFSLSDPSVVFWLQRYGIYVAGIQAAIFTVVSWYYWALMLAGVVGMFKGTS